MKYGDVVVYVRNGVPSNALIIQSAMIQVSPATEDQPAAIEEHATLLYLDPAAESSVMSSSGSERAVAKAFGVAQLKEGELNGFKFASEEAAEVDELEKELALVRTNAVDNEAKLTGENQDLAEKLDAATQEAADLQRNLNAEHEAKEALRKLLDEAQGFVGKVGVAAAAAGLKIAVDPDSAEVSIVALPTEDPEKVPNTQADPGPTAEAEPQA